MIGWWSRPTLCRRTKWRKIEKIGDAGWGVERSSGDMAACRELAPAPAAATSGATMPRTLPAATGSAGGAEPQSSPGGVRCRRPSSSSPKTKQKNSPRERTPVLHPLSRCSHSIGHWWRPPNQDADKRNARATRIVVKHRHCCQRTFAAVLMIAEGARWQCQMTKASRETTTMRLDLGAIFWSGDGDRGVQRRRQFARRSMATWTT